MLQTPYTDRLQALRQRLQKHPKREGLQNRVQNVRQKQQSYLRAQPAPLPYSGAYDSTMAAQNQTLASTQADLAGQGLALEQQYGFGTDTSNPFSVARQLERGYQQRRAGTQNSYAAAGQLYAGSQNDALGADRMDYEQSQDAAMREYLSQKASLASQGTQAQNAYSQNQASAYAEALQAALNQPPDPQEAGRPNKHKPNRPNKPRGGRR